jgi:hypothetical protein
MQLKTKNDVSHKMAAGNLDAKDKLQNELAELV